MPATDPGKSRLAYIDWARGLACLLMFQTHCYDSWLSSQARQGRFYVDSQLGGTFPAPLFLFLAGISFALVTEKLRRKNCPPTEIARSTIWRGAEILGFGLLLRLQEYVLSWGWAPKSDLFRVDILNTIGVSMMLMGVLCWAIFASEGAPLLAGVARSGDVSQNIPSASKRAKSLTLPITLSAATIALLISLLTPLVWTTWRPDWLPWPLESYINGVHNLGTPQAWMFPLFPWAGFAFVGLAIGFLLQSDWARAHESRLFLYLSIAGLILIESSRWLDAQPHHLYGVYDYWHTSPEFFLIRVGMILLIFAASYAWSRWGAAQWGFSPLIQLGQASLLVYWVHIEFVYGRVSILPKRAQSIAGASAGLAIIFVAMVALAYIRTHFKGWMKAEKSVPANPRSEEFQSM